MLKNILCHPTKQFIFFFTVILTFNNQIISPVDVSNIKDTYSILSDEFKHCSPVHGAVWAETHLLKKYYKHGNPEDSTIKLIKQLFNLVGDTFSITKAHNTIAHFTPKTIGEIIGAIEQKKDLSQLKLPKHSKYKTNATELLNNIANSLCECGFTNDPDIPASYPPYTTHAILLGFLYKKATTKNDFRSYFDQLKATVNPKSIFTPEGQTVFNQAGWNTNVFNTNEVDSIIKECSNASSNLPTDKAFPKVFNEQFEEVVFAEIIKQFYQQHLPKVIDDSSLKDTFLKNEKNVKIGVGFGDCTETTIRNLCNFILYDQSEGKFTPTKIKNATPSKKLLDFYQGENADATKHTNSELHQTWSDLVQNIPGVIYAQIISKTDNKEHYETDHDILHTYGRPCYVLLTQEDLKQIDSSKKSEPAKKQTNLGSSSGDNQFYSENFVKNTHKIIVGTEEHYIVADPGKYITYALWPSLKNIIIILNYLFGLNLYKDHLAPFKDEKFCSKYFPIMCEKFGWTYTRESSDTNLDKPYFNWERHHINLNLTYNQKAKWDIYIRKDHSEIKNASSTAEVSIEYRPNLFNIFLNSEESINSYDLLALYTPKTIDWDNLAKRKQLSDIRKKYLRILTGNTDVGSTAESEDPLKLNLKELKDSLTTLKNKLELLKTKLNGLNLALK